MRGIRRGAFQKSRKYLRGEMLHRGMMERGNNRKSEQLLHTHQRERKKEKDRKKKRREEKRETVGATVPLNGSAEEVCALT